MIKLIYLFLGMKILLVSATEFEIASIIEALGTPLVINNHINRYSTHHHQIDVLITGVGMVFTTFYLSTILANEQYDCSINAGVAGAIDSSLTLGEVVNVMQDFFYELGAEDADNWIGINELGFLGELDLPYAANGLFNNNMIALKQLINLKQVKGQTVNKIHGNAQSIKAMQSRSNAQIESMEGAAFLYCCLQYKLPCAQIRAISNRVEVRNKADWKMKEAILNLNLFVKELLLN